MISTPAHDVKDHTEVQNTTSKKTLNRLDAKGQTDVQIP